MLELLVHNPLPVVNISEAALFRSIDTERPTLLLDEYDAIFGAHARPQENLRAMLNAGHRRGATVVRCLVEGTRMEPKRSQVFCAKALAGIGAPPEQHSRTARSESSCADAKSPSSSKCFRRRDVEPEAAALKRQLETWALQAVESLRDAYPQLPRELDDRAADGWNPCSQSQTTPAETGRNEPGMSRSNSPRPLSATNPRLARSFSQRSSRYSMGRGLLR